MSDMGYVAMKKVLLKVKKLCEERGDCIERKECPFMGKLYCRIAEPSEWDIDDWKEDSNGHLDVRPVDANALKGDVLRRLRCKDGSGGEIMSKQAKPTRTCADCFHCQACHMWSNGAISATVSARCPQFEPARYASLKELQDLYKMHKGEVAPVRHGEWSAVVDVYKTCSECGEDHPETDRREFYIQDQYCPACGALMDGKEDENNEKM